MKYAVTVKTQAKENNVKQLSEHKLRVSIIAPREQGKANKMLIELLANYFKVPKWKIFIIVGKKSPHKVVEVM